MAVSAQNDVRGLRYIDDLVLNRQDSNADGDYIDSGDFTHYALTDHQFSVIALIDSAGNLIERVSYTPYGEARHHWRQDVDGDGDIDATDQSLVNAALNKRIYESGYNVDADFNRDGKVDKQDSALIGSRSFRGALPAGWISSLTTGNVIGFSGYVFNREIDAGGLYTVRFRHYDPVWGRWISRDPAGYADSMSLYGYGWGGPVSGSDPSGGDYYEWEDARGWKNGRRGTYHHQYRYVWHWYGLYYSREYVGSRFTADGDEIDDHGHSEYQRRVLQALNEGAGRVGDVANTTIAAAAILIVFVPGPEDVLVAMMAGVKFIKIGGKWFKVLADGTKTPADEAATSALEMAHFGERMKKLGYVENPHRAGSWGVYENGKFVEKARFDPAKPGAPGWGGKDHIHTDGGKDHLDPCTPVPGE